MCRSIQDIIGANHLRTNAFGHSDVSIPGAFSEKDAEHPSHVECYIHQRSGCSLSEVPERDLSTAAHPGIVLDAAFSCTDSVCGDDGRVPAAISRTCAVQLARVSAMQPRRGQRERV